MSGIQSGAARSCGRCARTASSRNDVLRSATFACVKTLNQRELRNDSAEVLRLVEQGETFTITRRGVPVAVLSPLPPSDLRCDRPATQRPTFASLERVRAAVSSTEVLNDLRGEQ